MRSLIAALLLTAAASPAVGQAKPGKPKRARKQLETELVANVTAVVPGQPFEVGVRFKVPPDHYAFGNPANDGKTLIGKSMFVKLAAPGFKFGEVKYPQPIKKREEID